METLPATRPQGLPTVDEAERLWSLAKRVATTDMVPGQFRGHPDQVLAAMVAGREIGLSPMESLRSFHVIDGKPSESAELLMTLALRAGHDVWVEQLTSTEVTVAGRRAEWPADRTPLRVTWTMDDADAAGLTGGRRSNWEKYPRAMLRSRAVAELVRALCPDVTVGATNTAEELGADVSGPHGTPSDRSDEDWTSAADAEAVEVLETVRDPDPEVEGEAVPTADEIRQIVRRAGPDGIQRFGAWVHGRWPEVERLEELDPDGLVVAHVEAQAIAADLEETP